MVWTNDRAHGRRDHALCAEAVVVRRGEWGADAIAIDKCHKLCHVGGAETINELGQGLSLGADKDFERLFIEKAHLDFTGTACHFSPNYTTNPEYCGNLVQLPDLPYDYTTDWERRWAMM